MMKNSVLGLLVFCLLAHSYNLSPFFQVTLIGAHYSEVCSEGHVVLMFHVNFVSVPGLLYLK